MYRTIIILAGLLATGPGYAQTYEQEVKKAVAAYGRNQLDSCVLYFNKAFAAGQAKGADLYNAAVCNTLNGNSKQAFSLLEKAIGSGINISKLRIDPDFESLHASRKWKKLLKKAGKVQQQEFRKTKYPAEAAMLATLWEKDQYLRFRLGKAYQKNDTITANELWNQLRHSDSLNLKEFQLVMDRIGWPTGSKVGSRGATTAFLIIDHSSREVMEKYFPLLEAAAKNGEASLSAYATLKDRILVNRGKKQIYATQRYWDAKAGKFVYFPVEDEKQVNAKRKEVGLEELADFPGAS